MNDAHTRQMTSTADENDANPDNLPLTRMSGRQIKDFWWTHRHPNTFTMILLPLCGVLDVNAIENSPVWSSYFRKLYESASTCVHLFLKGARAEPEKHKRMMYDMIKMAAEDFPNLPPVEQVPVLIHDLWASSPIS